MNGRWSAVYVDPDPQSLREAEERMVAEAASCVVRHARVEQTHRSFWRAVEAQRQEPLRMLRLRKGGRL